MSNAGLAAMSHQAHFNRILDKLYNRRTDTLRHLLAPKRGRLLTFTKTRREAKIRELQQIASEALAGHLAKREFEKAATRKKVWRDKGWGRHLKQKEFRKWARRELRRKRGKVYVFWRNHECRYVGRTQGSGLRPSQHFRRGWFNGTTRIDVYSTRQKKSIPLLECLAIHRFQPAKNKMKAARERGRPRCPVCAIHKKIRKELRKIYRFR